MTRFIEGCDRRQRLLLPDCIDDYVGEDSPVRVVDAFIDELDLDELGFAGPAATGRPGYHPATLRKLYLYGCLNQVQSSRRLEREVVHIFVGGALAGGPADDRSPGPCRGTGSTVRMVLGGTEYAVTLDRVAAADEQPGRS